MSIPKFSEINQNSPKANSKRDLDFFMAIGATICIGIAFVLGIMGSSSSVEPALKQAVPHAYRIIAVDDVTYAAQDNKGETFNYIALGEAIGYGGPMTLAVATDLKGDITGIAVVEHRETPAWFDRVIITNNFLEKLLGKSYSDPFTIGQDIHNITSATYTTRAIVNATLEASSTIASLRLGLKVPEKPEVPFNFGMPEIVLLVLFAVAYIGHLKSFKYTKQVRWLTLLGGMVFLGFVYTNPLTISLINQAILGFWPDWHTHLYFYLLLGGVFLVLMIDNINPYCHWFCPFGAVQECMGKVGDAKLLKDRKLKDFLKWAQRGLAFSAIIIALLFRNPGISSYEVFGTLFDLDGRIISFVLLGLTMITSIFIRRPWCSFLCPIPPVEDFVRLLRKRIKNRIIKAKTA